MPKVGCFYIGITMKVPPPNRRHEFRYAKCARQTFMCGGASEVGRMEVYYKSPAAEKAA